MLASLPSIAQSLPGKPVVNPCLTVTQRQRLADSLATLPVVRKAAREFRLSADAYAGQVQVEKQLKVDALVQADEYKGKAQRRGLVNVLLGLVIAAITYVAIQ